MIYPSHTQAKEVVNFPSHTEGKEVCDLPLIDAGQRSRLFATNKRMSKKYVICLLRKQAKVLGDLYSTLAG